MAEGAVEDVARDVDDVGDDSGGRRQRAGALAVEHRLADGVAAHEDGIVDAVDRSQWMRLRQEDRMDAHIDAVLIGILADSQQLDDIAEVLRVLDVVRRDLRDALDAHVIDRHVGVEAERGHNRGLVGRIVAFDVAGRIGFGVSLGLGVLEHVIEL